MGSRLSGKWATHHEARVKDLTDNKAERNGLDDRLPFMTTSAGSTRAKAMTHDHKRQRPRRPVRGAQRGRGRGASPDAQALHRFDVTISQLAA
jgi:hypothetical protein